MKTGTWGWPMSPITRHRVERGDSVDVAARRTGLTVERWSAIERGATEPTDPEIVVIARAVGTTVSRLTAELEQSPVPQSQEEAWFDERIRYSLLARHLGATSV